MKRSPLHIAVRYYQRFKCPAVEGLLVPYLEPLAEKTTHVRYLRRLNPEGDRMYTIMVDQHAFYYARAYQALHDLRLLRQAINDYRIEHGLVKPFAGLGWFKRFLWSPKKKGLLPS